jgi:hypothetical protein
MSTFFASVNGQQIVSGTLMIPLIGAWTADVQLATSTPLSGTCTVVIGNLTLNGFVYRSEPYGGQVQARIVAGAGGWRTEVQKQGYGSKSGVKLGTILNDVAGAVMESVNVANNTSVGPAFTRITGAASDVLWQLYAQGIIPAWYIDPSGVTQVTAWPSVVVGSSFTVTDQKSDEGLVVVATEDYASWLPGCSFSGPTITGTYNNAGVTYVWDNEGTFRMEVLTQTGNSTEDRVIGPLNAVIDARVAPTRFYGRYEYTISNPSTSTVDGSPTDTTLGLPDLQNIPLDADSISSYSPANGGTCHIMFLNGQATQPICVWTSGNPTMASLLGGSNPVARLGDQVQCFLPPSLVCMGTVSGEPFVGTITVVNPITGTITQGSSQVNSA